MTFRHFSFGAAVLLAVVQSASLASERDCSAPSLTASCCQRCQTCDPCQTCEPGAITETCCSGVHSIDVDSLKPKAQSKKLYGASQARLIFVLPDDRPFVYLAGMRMLTLGKRREYTVPVGNQSESYEYDIKVDTVHDGQLYHKLQQLENVRAGSIIQVTVGFVPPVAEEGLPADITFEVQTIAAGGEAETAGGEAAANPAQDYDSGSEQP